MMSNGLDSVKIYTNNESSVSVRGKLDNRFTLVFKKDIKQDKQFVRLNGGNGAGTVVEWNQSAPDNLPLIIETAKVYAFPNQEKIIITENESIQEEPRPKTFPRWVMPTAIGVIVFCVGLGGIYFGQELWKQCRGFEPEVTQP
ncbi:MAG: hypothetical protein F6J89_07410 [Symploca sp. SIO1C4]|uniref:Uncharacterized protein n=1 Tax=Symploca sp. SIO1C4 TaxID=2607765 RepID=A0A6B3NA23_9CYAN|nr:hypothetical protein [Symploca sp. SIO1C4]